MGYASLGKRDSQDYICAIGHLDVVPVVYAERGRALIHFHASSTHDLFDFMNKYILNADHTGIK